MFEEFPTEQAPGADGAVARAAASSGGNFVWISQPKKYPDVLTSFRNISDLQYIDASQQFSVQGVWSYQSSKAYKQWYEDKIHKWKLGTGIGVGAGVPVMILVAFVAGRELGMKKGR